MLKILRLQKELREKQAELIQVKDRAKELEKREEDLERDIEEAKTQEDREAVDQAIEKYESEKDDIENEQTRLEGDIAEIEEKIRELEENAPRASENNANERKDSGTMETRYALFGMSEERTSKLMEREDVKDFIGRTREFMQQKRAVSGAELLVPTVILGLIRENIQEYSKLLKYVNYKNVSGAARQTVMGTIPEAVWTEAVDKLNELDISFAQDEVDGYKVAGYFAVPNALLEDSDISLAAELIAALGQAIGYSVDKAILYGTGVKMPLGAITRLAQTSKPENYPKNAREWKDLHTTNIITIGSSSAKKTGIDLFKDIVTASGKAKGKYSAGVKVWVMNETTKTALISEALNFNAAGAIVTGQSGIMPVVGGDIVTFEDMADGDIFGGYGDLYLLAERAGTTIAQSEHNRFVEDQTVFRGVARYDGKPIIAEGFVLMNILGNAPTTSVSFAQDKANP